MKCNTIFIVKSTMQRMCNFSHGILAQSLSMETNTDMNPHSEANSLLHARPQLRDLPVAFRNNAPASSTAGPRRTTRSDKN